MKQPRLTKEQIWAVLNDVKFLDRKWHLQEKGDGGDGYLLQLSYMEADIETGKLERQKSRKHYISPFMTVDEIVDTCFLCVMRSMEHTTREHFMYRGELVQSPHFSIEARVEMCQRKMFARRIPPKGKP